VIIFCYNLNDIFIECGIFTSFYNNQNILFDRIQESSFFRKITNNEFSFCSQFLNSNLIIDITLHRISDIRPQAIVMIYTDYFHRLIGSA